MTDRGISKPSSLRGRILAFVLGLIVLSLLGSTVALYRITEVNRFLDAINRVSVPLGRQLTQMQSDADVFRRELERSLGYSHWSDSRWRARPMPQWIEGVLQSEVDRVKELVKTDSAWTDAEARKQWLEWIENIDHGLAQLKIDAAKLYQALSERNMSAAEEIYPRWSSAIEEWRRQLQWGSTEYERSLRQSFKQAQTRASELRTGLEILLVVVVLLSLLLLWLGERALRPMAELTRLARDITRRGLRKEDKALLPDVPLSRSDEVSQLAREFHRMATALLEREKVVETQKSQLQEQNRLLRRMGELNENVLKSIHSILIVTDLKGEITQCNPTAKRWLADGASNGTSPIPQIIGSKISQWPTLAPLLQERGGAKDSSIVKIEAFELQNRVYGGHLMPLLDSEGTGSRQGAILVIDDLTDELDLQHRLQRAESLAAIGRMSAQVAHEVRNPLHSIGLEAELAAEMAASTGSLVLKQSLQSILSSVDRLEKITQNYLKLSRLSAGEKRMVDIGEVIENVLATYASASEGLGITVDWKRLSTAPLRVFGDADLLEQALGNLQRNAIQALEGASGRKLILWTIGCAESGRIWVRIEDSGPGISADVRGKLFTPFVTTKPQGTGLGLSFVRKVIEDHGGLIECLEPQDGAGARFEVVLPEVVLPMTAEVNPADPRVEQMAGMPMPEREI